MISQLSCTSRVMSDLIRHGADPPKRHSTFLHVQIIFMSSNEYTISGQRRSWNIISWKKTHASFNTPLSYASRRSICVTAQKYLINIQVRFMGVREQIAPSGCSRSLKVPSEFKWCFHLKSMSSLPPPIVSDTHDSMIRKTLTDDDRLPSYKGRCAISSRIVSSFNRDYKLRITSEVVCGARVCTMFMREIRLRSNAAFLICFNSVM